MKQGFAITDTSVEPVAPAAARSTDRIVSFPPVLAANPYQRLLYARLATCGIVLEDGGEFTVRWLLGARRRVRYLHFHWQEGHYRVNRLPRLRAAWWLKLGVFAVRLAAARALGFHIVWTIHQVAPHESSGRMLDRAGALLLSRAAHVLMAHDTPTANRARRELRLRDRPVGVVPIGSYEGVYPPGRPRDAVRKELGIPSDTFAFLCFGGLRAYKDTDLLLDAFAAVDRSDVRLVVAGPVGDTTEGDEIRARAALDPRVVTRLAHIPDDQVSELFAACDAAVFPRGDGGTSSSLILALSMGRAAIVADAPAYTDLTGGEEAGWLFRTGDRDSLCRALGRAAADPADAERRGQAALGRARRLSWESAGQLTADLMRGRAARTSA